MRRERELPSTWLECTLGEVVAYGITRKAEPKDIPPTAWVLELEDIERDTSKILRRVSLAERKSKSTKNKFESGDILYGKLRPYLNKVVQADRSGYCTTEILPLRPPPGIDARYLFHWLKTPRFLEYVQSVSHGLNMPRLGAEAGKSAPFVLAPECEQTRIADKIESLNAHISGSRLHLDRVPEMLRRLRDAVLDAATCGWLTREWREERDGENSTGVNRANRFPSAWSVQTLDSVRSSDRPISYGVLKPGPYARDGVPMLRIVDILSGSPDVKGAHRISKELSTEYRRTQLQGGELLISVVGTVGKIALVPASAKGSNVHRNLAVVAPSARIHSGFLLLALQSPSIQAQIAAATTGANQPLLNLADIRNLSVPVPPEPEQLEIVRRAGKLLGLANTLEARHATTVTLVERLAASTLANAFCGNLVQQDSSDEPASVLLERFRAERTSTHGEKKRPATRLAPSRTKSRARPKEVPRKTRRAL